MIHVKVISRRFHRPAASLSQQHSPAGILAALPQSVATLVILIVDHIKAFSG
jgi:hypothetical protein